MRKNGNRKKRVGRGNQGAVIAGFAAELVVGTMVVIAFSFFLLDTIISLLYQEKLACITAQGAVFAAEYSGNNMQDDTKAYVSGLCNQMGLPAADLKIQTVDTSVNGKAATSCTVSSAFFLLNGSFLPPIINLSDTSVALVPTNVPGAASVSLLGNSNMVNISTPVRVVQSP